MPVGYRDADKRGTAAAIVVNRRSRAATETGSRPCPRGVRDNISFPRGCSLKKKPRTPPKKSRKNKKNPEKNPKIFLKKTKNSEKTCFRIFSGYFLIVSVFFGLFRVFRIFWVFSGFFGFFRVFRNFWYFSFFRVSRIFLVFSGQIEKI